MSSQDKKVDVVRPKVFLGLAVVVLLGFCLYPSTISLYSRYVAWGAKRYCESMLASGETYGSSDDYTSKLKNCERNPRFCPYLASGPDLRCIRT